MRAPPPLAADRSLGMADALPANQAPIAPPAPPVIPNAAQVRAQVYTVQSGDTLRGIGNRTGAGSEIIAKANGLAPPYLLRPGQRLNIPGGRYHTVGAGETGLTIAQAYGVSWAEVVALNGLGEPFILRMGQRLLLPAEPVRSLTPEQRAAAFHLDIDDAVSGSTPAEPEVTINFPPPSSAHSSAPTPAPAAAFDGRFVWPAQGRVIARFGPASGGVRNAGIDIALPAGSPVSAAAPGTVSFASGTASIFGGLVLITHGSGWVSAYGYLGRVDAKLGQRVKAGEVIALSGDHGLGAQPKLHFELRKDRRALDPLTRLPAQ